jgi:hypothetical protein
MFYDAIEQYDRIHISGPADIRVGVISKSVSVYDTIYGCTTNIIINRKLPANVFAKDDGIVKLSSIQEDIEITIPGVIFSKYLESVISVTPQTGVTIRPTSEIMLDIQSIAEDVIKDVLLDGELEFNTFNMKNLWRFGGKSYDSRFNVNDSGYEIEVTVFKYTINSVKLERFPHD